MPRISEPAFNSYLLQELVRISPKWQLFAGAEQTQMLRSKPKQPNLTITTSAGRMVIVETEFIPASTVEKDALSRLTETLLETNEPVQSVVAIRIPQELRIVEGDLSANIRSSSFEYCLFEQQDQGVKRWPQKG